MDVAIGRRWTSGAAAVLVAASTCGLTSHAAAADPGGKPLFTIKDKVKLPGRGGPAVFDRAALEGLGMAGFETPTPWHNVLARFGGVPMSHLLDGVGAYGATA